MTHAAQIATMLLFALLLSSAPASADVVGPPPMSCPPGSTPTSSHSGPLCFPSDACTMDAECAMGGTCMEVFQCIETRSCGGLVPPDSGPCTVSHVVGPCGLGNSCTTGTCFTRHICSTDPLTHASGGGCACSIGARAMPAGGAAIAIAAIVLGLASRRRRSSTCRA